MPTCVPIKEMKDTAKFTRLIEQTSGPVTVTKNGYDAFVVMRSGEYEAMQQELTKARLMQRIAVAEHEYATGQYREGASVVSDIRKTYGL